MENDQNWLCGVRGGIYRADLPETVALERNLLGVPLCVLNPRASKTCNELIYEWGSDDQKSLFVFERPRLGAFPLPQHAVYLSVLLAMFANNFRDDGVLQFKFADVVRNAGKVGTSRGSILTVQETIKRYSMCMARWHYAWKGEEHTWHGPIIIGEDVWKMTAEGTKIKRNPRRASDHDAWHRIRFHPHVVGSVKERLTRVFLTELLKDGISAAAFCVYRYFYGFSDSSDVKRSLGQLMHVFPWQGQKDRFEGWLVRCLEELKEKGYVETFSVDAGVVVKCRNIQEIKHQRKQRVIEEEFKLLRQRL